MRVILAQQFRAATIHLSSAICQINVDADAKTLPIAMAPSAVFQFINSFVPFAVPTRPLWIDIVLTLIYATLLYVGPQIPWETWTSHLPTALQDSLQQRRTAEPLAHPADDRAAEAAPDASASDSDASDSDADPAPLAIPPRPTVEDAPDAGTTPSTTARPSTPPPPARPPPASPRTSSGCASSSSSPPRSRTNRAGCATPRARSARRRPRPWRARERVRAYHEFVREQVDQRRALDASTAEAREWALEAERARRKEAEREIAEREKERRERERERREEAGEREVRDGERVREAVRRGLDERGMVSVDEVAGEIGRGGSGLRRLSGRTWWALGREC